MRKVKAKEALFFLFLYFYWNFVLNVELLYQHFGLCTCSLHLFWMSVWWLRCPFFSKLRQPSTKNSKPWGNSHHHYKSASARGKQFFWLYIYIYSLQQRIQSPGVTFIIITRVLLLEENKFSGYIYIYIYIWERECRKMKL